MRKQAFTILLILGLGSLTWGAAQGTKQDLFDLKKSRQELEVMKGILSTTIGFVANEIQGRDSTTFEKMGTFFRYGGFGSDITSYYLYGQGATFVVPISSFRFASTRGGRLMAWSNEPKIATTFDDGMNDALEQVQEQMEALNFEMAAKNEEMAAAARETAEAAQSLALEVASEFPNGIRAGVVGGVPGGVVGGVGGGVIGGVPGGVGTGVGVGTGSAKGRGTGTIQATPTPQAPPSPPTPAVAPRPAKPQVDREEMRRRLEDAQVKVRKAREDVEARRKKLLESLTQVSGYLIEALANHGDSLTQVKPNEYINIIITTDEATPLLGDSGESQSRRQVISVQKSSITDYKAGRITIDGFKQKVLQYGT